MDEHRHGHEQASLARFACDIHTHTLASRHAYSTIGECVAAARERGLEVLGSTDHFSQMISATVDVRDYQYFMNFGVWPREWDGVRVLHGVEADIVDLEGHLFGWDIRVPRGITGRAYEAAPVLKDIFWYDLDYAIASIHDSSFAEGATIAQTTAMYLGVIEDPKVLVLGHVARSGVPFDLDVVLGAVRDAHKLVEVNEHSLHPRFGAHTARACRDVLVRCAELGVPIATGTDAHIACDVGRFERTAALLDEIHFPAELVATASAERFFSFVEGLG